jgi:tRNA modification GTPase
VIRASGKGAIAAAGRLFRGTKALEAVPGHTLVHGHIVDPSDGGVVDEVLVAVFRSPASYTGQDGVEVTCHGGPAVVARIIGLFHGNGYRPAGPGEFTLRAFRAGRMDLTRAEAVNELIRARSDRARELALSRLSGSVSRRVDDIKAGVLALQSNLELHLDYPEDEIDAPLPRAADVRARAQEVHGLLMTYATGRLVQEGARVAIAGRTNSGKSSLFNQLLREDRSIVSEDAGTTRDYIEAGLSVHGYGIRLFDTAGLGVSADAVEREGVRRTGEVVGAADLVLYLVDGTRGFQADDAAYGESLPETRLVRVWSKADLAPPPPAGYVACSGRTGAGVAQLSDVVAARLFGGLGTDHQTAIIDSERQRDLLERAREALERAAAALETSVPLDLVAVDVREALDALGEITGAVTTAQVLDSMFSRFCVGK